MPSRSLIERLGAPGHSGRPRFVPATNLGVTMSERTLSFADVVGDEEEFFRTYFNKRVFYRPRGITGDPRQILSIADMDDICLLYTSPSPRDGLLSRMPSSA